MIIPFDTTALTNFLLSSASLSPAVQRAKAIADGANNRGPSVIPPWKLPPPPSRTENILSRVLGGRTVFDLNDPSLDRPGVDDNFRKLFTLFQGLTRLGELAEFAATDRQADTLRIILDRKLQEGLKELTSFLDSTKFEDVSIVKGLKESQIFASALIPSARPSMFVSGPEITTERSEPLANVQDQIFFIDIEGAAGAKSITIDLSQMGDPVANPRDIDSVAQFINDQLEAAGGVLVRVQTERFDEFSYGLQVITGSGESVRFRADPADQQPAVYIAGTNGFDDLASGFISKFDNLGAAAPQNEFLRSIDSEDARDEAAGVAIDSRGNVYIVGSTEGELDGLTNPDQQDVFLTKYDNAGQKLFTRLLGARTGTARAFAIAIDSQDNVIIAGSVTGDLISTAIGGQLDGFVTKFDPTGQEIFTHQRAPIDPDSNFSVVVDASDNIIIGGFSERPPGPFPGVDGRITRLDSNGVVLSEQTIGGITDTLFVDLAIANDGNLLTLAEAGGDVVVRKLDANGAFLWEANLGALGANGRAGGLAVDATGIYVTGTTSSGVLNGVEVNAFTGGTDGFVVKLDDSGNIGAVTYIGTADDERVGDIAVSGGQIFIAGETTGLLSGAAMSGTLDGFLAKFDSSLNNVFIEQYGGSFGQSSAAAIAIDPAGSSVVSRLGLTSAELPIRDSETITAITSIRAGQEFNISINGQRPKRITIGARDSFTFLRAKITAILGGHGKASLEETEGGRNLRISATNGAEVHILPGRTGRDALGGLGLGEKRIFGTPAAGQTDVPGASVFGLGIIARQNLLTQKASSDISALLEGAKKQVRDAFDFLTGAADKANPFAGLKPPPAYLLARIANFQAALDRLTAGQRQTGPTSIFQTIFRI